MASHAVTALFTATGSLAGSPSGIKRVKGLGGTTTTFSGTGSLSLNTSQISFKRVVTHGFVANSADLDLNLDLTLITRSQVWWDKSYTYRRILQIQPNTEGFEIDHPFYAVLGKDSVLQNKVRADGADIEVLQLVQYVPETWAVLPKKVTMGDSTILVEWANQIDIPADSIIKDLYYIYYGNSSLVNRPEDLSYEPTVWPVSVGYDSGRLTFTRPGEHWQGSLGVEGEAKATLQFYGSKVHILSNIGPDYGIAEVQVDDSDWQQVDLYAPVEATDVEVFLQTGLSLDYHTIRFRRSGFKAASATSTNINLQKIEYLRHNGVANVMEEADETLMWGSVIGGVVGK